MVKEEKRRKKRVAGNEKGRVRKRRKVGNEKGV